MAEINGYLLTKEEEQECVDLIKKMRKRKIFTINFSGCIRVKTRTPEEANEIFWNWVGDVKHLKNISLSDWCRFAIDSPYIENEGVEEE